MADFNIAPEIGGVDTSDPNRPYDQDEQFAVVSTVFGNLPLPGGQGKLVVGRRHDVETKRGYSTQPGRLWVPTYPKEGVQLLFRDDTVFRDGEYGGFLATATGATLNVGRMAYRDQTTVKRLQSEDFKRRRMAAITGVIRSSGLDVNAQCGLRDHHEIGQDLAVFAGHARGEVLTLVVNGDIDNPYLLFARAVVERLRAIRQTSD